MEAQHAHNQNNVDKHLTAGFATVAIHAGQEPEKWKCMAVVPPIVTTTTFKHTAPNVHQGFVYARDGNPTRATLETCLAAIEGAKYALAFASGMGAASAIVDLLSCGDHMITSGDIYGGSTMLFSAVVARRGIEVTNVNFTDIKSVRKAMKPNTKMIWLESPTNPLLKVVDIAAVVAEARTKPGVIVVVDNTFLTPYFQRPLDLGADISMHSITKYMNGHSDVIMGSAAMNDADLAKRLQFLQMSTGIVPSPFDCYLVNRSLKTLALRLDKHRKNSLVVAEWLTKQPGVTEVMHPELPSHPQYGVTMKQTRGHSGVFSFRHRGGVNETKVFVGALKLFTLAESLGGCESLAALPYIMSHAELPEHQKLELGITDNLIRLSVGLEDADALLADLEQAFKKTFT